MENPNSPQPAPALPPDPQGSNGFAIAPSHSANGHALLYINPHTTFYFRSEAQVQSDEGLDAYGASTWGQFFIYQGFNRHMGWMHTTSGLDSVDEFALEVRKAAGGRMEYRYGSAWEPFRTRDVTLNVRQPDGSMATRTITTFHSRHGPVTRRQGDKWIATALMLKPRAALEQSWLRTKARDIPAFIKISERRANSSNNSLLADDRGNIAFLMPQFVPRRDNRFDYKKARRRQRPRHPLAGRTHARRAAAGHQPRQRLGAERQQPPLDRRRRRQPQGRRPTPATWTVPAGTRANPTPSRCSAPPPSSPPKP